MSCDRCRGYKPEFKDIDHKTLECVICNKRFEVPENLMRDNLTRQIEQLEQDIVELKEARERESERLDWLLAKLGDKTLSLVIGEFPVDVSYWRDRIDKAKRYGN